VAGGEGGGKTLSLQNFSSSGGEGKKKQPATACRRFVEEGVTSIDSTNGSDRKEVATKLLSRYPSIWQGD